MRIQQISKQFITCKRCRMQMNLKQNQSDYGNWITVKGNHFISPTKMNWIVGRVVRIVAPEWTKQLGRRNWNVRMRSVLPHHAPSSVGLANQRIYLPACPCRNSSRAWPSDIFLYFFIHSNHAIFVASCAARGVVSRMHRLTLTIFISLFFCFFSSSHLGTETGLSSAIEKTQAVSEYEMEK